MSEKKQRLELNWVGKEKRPRLEPRILLEDAEKSYHAAHKLSEHDIFDNKLIHGDNLLALKALEQEYTGKVKCIYIDPPYNTGNAFEHYDDGLEHSIWLSLMRDRLELLHRLLADDGFLWLQLDDSEMHYAKVVCDELFGRENFISTICVKMSHLSGVKMAHVNKKPPKLKEYILLYGKNKQKFILNPEYEPVSWESSLNRYNQYIENIDGDISGWIVRPVAKVAAELGIYNDSSENYTRFLIENSHRIIRTARNASFKKTGIKNKFMRVTTKTGLEKISYNDEEVLFASDKILEINGIKAPHNPVGDLWSDIFINNLHNEGSVIFKNGKKPEALLKRIVSMSTNFGDLVLDSFLGSGTTAAVAHKMGRRWIGIELGNHCETHCIPRLQKVIDGSDQGGISKAVNWQGGGGFRYYRLAPSMLEKDKWGNWIISKKYNAVMLAEAMCKIMGFTYAPSEAHYWEHGKSNENDFIYVTTQTLDQVQLEALCEDVGTTRTLMVCCTGFRAKIVDHPNLTLKKIPRAVLEKCEWGTDDYSLNVQNLPAAIEEEK